MQSSRRKDNPRASKKWCRICIEISLGAAAVYWLLTALAWVYALVGTSPDRFIAPFAVMGLTLPIGVVGLLTAFIARSRAGTYFARRAASRAALVNGVGIALPFVGSSVASWLYAASAT
jgi:hypothetical protein